MPEAQKEQIQDDKLVPIDTSGESVDVELKESKVTPVEEEQEVVEEQQAAPEPEKTEEENRQRTKVSTMSTVKKLIKELLSSLVNFVKQSAERMRL